MPIIVRRPEVLEAEVNLENEEKPIATEDQKISEDYHGGDEITMSMDDQRFSEQAQGQSEHNQEQNAQEQQNSTTDKNQEQSDQQEEENTKNSSQQSQEQESMNENESNNSQQESEQNHDDDDKESQQAHNSENTASSNETEQSAQQSDEKSEDQQNTKNNKDDNTNREGEKDEEENMESEAEINENKSAEESNGNNEEEGDKDEEDDDNEDSEDNEEDEEDDEQSYSHQFNTNEVVNLSTRNLALHKQLYNTVYMFVEYLADEQKTVSPTPSATMVLNVKRLMMRKYEKKPLKAYYDYRERQQIIIMLDDSGSMAWLASELNTILQSAAKRRDVIIYTAPNGVIERMYDVKRKAFVEVDHNIEMKRIMASGLPVLYVGDFDGANTPVKLSWTNKVYWVCPETRYKWFSEHDWVSYRESDFQGFFGRAADASEIIKVIKLFAKNLTLNQFWYDPYDESEFPLNPDE